MERMLLWTCSDELQQETKNCRRLLKSWGTKKIRVADVIVIRLRQCSPKASSNCWQPLVSVRVHPATSSESSACSQELAASSV
eukprot:4381063-Amphidinium_carterae.1